MPRGKGVGVGPELGGGMDDMTSLFFGARHPFCPGFGGTYWNGNRAVLCVIEVHTIVTLSLN